MCSRVNYKENLLSNCLLCSTLRTKFDELERQLDAAQRAQHGEEAHSRQLATQVQRLQGRLQEGAAKQAELGQQLWWVLGL